MNKKLKRTTSLLLVFGFIITLFCITGFATTTNTLMQDVALYEGGRLEIVGAISGGSNLWVSCCVVEHDNPTNFIYLDQTISTTNGVYLFRFNVLPINKGKTLDFKIGGDNASPITKTITMPDFPININSVEDNSIRIGMDVYQMDSTYYTPNNVVDSIKQGGNTIYYKIGGRWYDLLNVNATSSRWLVPANAVNTTVVNAWLLDMWHPRGTFGKIKFDPILF